MTALPLPCLSLHHRFNVMSLQLGPLGGACAPQHSRLLCPLRAFDRPDQRGRTQVTLSCAAFTLLGSWCRDRSWLLPALPAHCSPSRPAPQGPLCLCLATGSTSSGISLCQIQLSGIVFFSRWPSSALLCTVRRSTHRWGDREASHVSRKPGLLHVADVQPPRPLSRSFPPSSLS